MSGAVSSCKRWCGAFPLRLLLVNRWPLSAAARLRPRRPAGATSGLFCSTSPPPVARLREESLEDCAAHTHQRGARTIRPGRRLDAHRLS